MCVVVTNLIYRFKHSGNCYHVLYLCCSVFISRRTSILKWHISSSLLLLLFIYLFMLFLLLKMKVHRVSSGVFVLASHTLVFSSLFLQISL